MYPDFNPAADMEAARNGRGGAFSLNNDSPAEDQALAIRFYMDVRKNIEKSKQEGRLVCDDVEMLEIRIPGGSDLIRKEVGDQERERFHKQYAAFRSGVSQDKVSGTPLSEWPIMGRAQVEEAAYFGVRTVEAMAVIPDSHLQKMGAGWLEIRSKAKNWLQKAKDGALVNRLQEMLDERDRRIDAMEKMLATQGKDIEAARNAGGVLATAPTGISSADVLRLIESKMATAQKPAVVPEAPKKRGWPKGKPRKPAAPVETKE